jgi:sigma-B regulation protein RsbU (phosphoserine phosphatase)
MKILIAEDESVAAEILLMSLESLGHEVTRTSNGLEAWDTFDRDPIRLIVSDWFMPGLDGLGLCQKIRARKNTPYTDLATAAGVDDFLTKPLDQPTIRMRLRVAERILRFATQIHQLQDLIPICAYCRKIRTDDNYWQIVEVYIAEQTGSNFTHGMCPDCAARMMAELEKMQSPPNQDRVV